MASKTHICPLLQKNCIEHRCLWYIQVQGTNKNTGAEVNEWGCAVSWLPILMLETANMARHTTASVDSLRNTMVKGEDETRKTIMTGFGLFGPFQSEEQLPLQLEDGRDGGT